MTPLTDPPSAIWKRFPELIWPALMSVIALESNDVKDVYLFRSPPYSAFNSDRIDLAIPGYAGHKGFYEDILNYATINPEWFRIVAPLLYKNISINSPGNGRISTLADRLRHRIEPANLYIRDKKNPEIYLQTRAGEYVTRLDVHLQFGFRSVHPESLLDLISQCPNLIQFGLHFAEIEDDAIPLLHNFLRQISVADLMPSVKKVVLNCPHVQEEMIDSVGFFRSLANLTVLVYREYIFDGDRDVFPITDSVLSNVALPLVHTLICTNVTEISFRRMAGIYMPRLTNLKVVHNPISLWPMREAFTTQHDYSGLLHFLGTHGETLHQVQVLDDTITAETLKNISSCCSKVNDLFISINSIRLLDSDMNIAKVALFQSIDTLSISGLRDQGTYEKADIFFRSLDDTAKFPKLRRIFITAPGWFGNEQAINSARLAQDKAIWHSVFKARELSVVDEMAEQWERQGRSNWKSDVSSTGAWFEVPSESSSWRNPLATEERSSMFKYGYFDIDRHVRYRYNFE